MSVYEPPKNGFRTFLIIWVTQSFSVFGSALTMFALNIWLMTTMYPNPEQKPQLAGALMAVNLAAVVPALLVAPFAGAWADRHDRKMTMFWSDLGSGVLMVVLALLMGSGRLELWMVMLGAGIGTLLGTFHGSAFDTSYAMLLRDDQLPRANGMMQTMWALSTILSPAIAAFLISIPALARQGYVPGTAGAWLGGIADGTGVAVTVDAITFVVAAAVLPFLFVPSPRRADMTAANGEQKSIWADVRVGMAYIWHRRPMLWLLGTFALVNFTTPFGIILPLLVKFNLAPDWAARGYTIETAMALVNTVASLGGLAGGLIVSAWGGLKSRRVYGVLVPLLFGGAMVVVLGLSSLLYLAAVAGFLVAAHFPFANVHSQTIWQTQTPRELQGRVFAVRRVIAQFTGPISMAITGWLTGLFNPGHVMAVMGGITVLFMAAQLFNPYLLRVEDKEYLDGLAAERERSEVAV